MPESPEQTIKLTALDVAAAVLASGQATLVRANRGAVEDLVTFELALKPGGADVLARFVAGNLVGNLALFAQEQRSLRRLLRATRDAR